MLDGLCRQLLTDNYQYVYYVFIADNTPLAKLKYTADGFSSIQFVDELHQARRIPMSLCSLFAVPRCCNVCVLCHMPAGLSAKGDTETKARDDLVLQVLNVFSGIILTSFGPLLRYGWAPSFARGPPGRCAPLQTTSLSLVATPCATQGIQLAGGCAPRPPLAYR